MSIESKPIGLDSELCRTLTCLPEKFVVDFANGIDVTRDHLQVQRQQNDVFVSRLMDGLTGKSARRQAEINASLADGVEASLRWLTELSRDLAQSNLAIAAVNDRVSWLTGQVGKLAIYSEETRQQFYCFAVEMGERMAGAEQALARLEFKQDVKRNIDGVFAKWRAGRLGRLSPAARCYAVLEELRWGDFGDYIRDETSVDKEHFIQLVVDRAVKCMADDINAAPGQRISMATWLDLPRGASRDDDWSEALAYLADGYEVSAAPFVTTVTRSLQEWHDDVPRIAKPDRIAEAIFEETFHRGCYA